MSSRKTFVVSLHLDRWWEATDIRVNICRIGYENDLCSLHDGLASSRPSNGVRKFIGMKLVSQYTHDNQPQTWQPSRVPVRVIAAKIIPTYAFGDQVAIYLPPYRAPLPPWSLLKSFMTVLISTKWSGTCAEWWWVPPSNFGCSWVTYDLFWCVI